MLIRCCEGLAAPRRDARTDHDKLGAAPMFDLVLPIHEFDVYSFDVVSPKRP
ncbi:MAG TPA: hypothetical protein PK271_07340 [Hyphomicrobium sp.]|uniref:hypothetical protein n=1 Tax=Hyphomicrobium sp. TaxID=82 RepID=UPI002CC9E1F7|nr:hypothetical protein [Hyphomicrobium sp.]HRN88402.1 hypothetical protein [Hyphomicrobium sp.]